MSTTHAPLQLAEPDPAEVEAFVGQFATDLAAVLHATTVVIGDRLGLYTELARSGPSTAADLAKATGYDPRYLQEWLSAQAAAGYAHFDPATGRFHLDAAQAACLADETLPTFLAGGMAVGSSTHRDQDAIVEAYRSGDGVGWHQHHADLFTGTERFFRPGYAANLVAEWIPAIEGLDARLTQGGTVADIGCGHGASSILLAKAYPKLSVVGFDYHPESIRIATERAEKAGVSDHVRFEVAKADDIQAAPGGYDMVCIFDALHDMGDPLAVAKEIRSRIAPDGVWLLVEPNANDALEDNLNLIGKIFYSASSTICTPASRSDGGSSAACLGAQAGEARLRDLCIEAGFSSVRRAAETPFNMVLEVRP
ncbi:class I SAM-dependent methyltransferase [Aquihabitans sp. McL0605]|uniref:class I SAM-dependent methyltransferase n=1 Tax=Aquihabitans sp. McL0605 TaxID=3415671 RepID=UPI003CF81398